MSKMIAVRLHEKTLSELDQECTRVGLTRAAAVKEALRLWVDQRRYEAAKVQDQEAYDRHPVSEDEFEPVLGAQVWPK